MTHATQPPPPRTGPALSGYCRGDGVVVGHEYCSAGPVMVGDVEVIPQWCFCPCHEEVRR
ncbi:hypothetical protein [Streptomyces cinereoruber]|uniref:hypothetical protein n=1 Tax=Streptomyces cinereoruber TaxID=67260 RepID=UPI00339B15D5